MLPVTLNPPGKSLVFGADEPCTSPAQTVPAQAATNVQMDAARPENGTQSEPEDSVLEPTVGACVPLTAFAAAGEPVFAAHVAGSSFGFGGTLSQLVVLAGTPAAIAKVIKAVANKKGGNGEPAVLPPKGNNGNSMLPRGGAGGAGASGDHKPATPTPEPTSTLLIFAGAALVGRRVVQGRAGR